MKRAPIGFRTLERRYALQLARLATSSPAARKAAHKRAVAYCASHKLQAWRCAAAWRARAAGLPHDEHHAAVWLRAVIRCFMLV